MLLTRLGKDRVKGVAMKAGASDQVGGFEAFLRQANRFIPVEVVKVCKHDRVLPGQQCMGCSETPSTDPVTTTTDPAPAAPAAAPDPVEVEEPGATLTDLFKKARKGGTT
jgi:hypothetical protein